jgi:hypothetical protein
VRAGGIKNVLLDGKPINFDFQSRQKPANNLKEILRGQPTIPPAGGLRIVLNDGLKKMEE